MNAERSSPITQEDRQRFIRAKERGLVEAALKYAGRGWKVLPCHSPRPDGGCTCGASDCGNVGKHPWTANGLNDATTDPDAIRAWWERWPIANIAIRTDGLLVLDCDKKPGLDGRETLAELEEKYGFLPTTVEAITGGGGTHIVLREPSGTVRNSTGKLGPGLDVRASGGYIIAPPSTHRSAIRYQWEASSHPDDVEVADAPQWLIQLCRNGQGGNGTPAPGVVSESKPGRWSVDRPPNGDRHGRLRDLCYRWAHWLSEGEVRFMAFMVAEKWDLLAEGRGGEVENLVVGAFLKLKREGKVSEDEDQDEPITVLPALDLAAEPAPVPDPLVGDDKTQLLMPNEITVLASDPGVGKTKLLSEIALSVASGKTCLGLPTIQGPVVYVTSDGDPDMQRNLLRQWLGRGEARESLGTLPLHVHVDPDFCIESGKSLERVELTLNKWDVRPRLLILESLATNVAGTDLNDQAAVRRYARCYLRPILAEHPGIAVALSAHLKKLQAGGPNDLGTRVAGSMQIRGAVDCVIALVAQPGNSFVARRVKRSRSGADFEAFKVRIVGARTEPLTLVHEGLATVSDEELQGAAKAVMTYMRETGGKRKLTEICEALKACKPKGFQSSAIQKACRRLAEVERLLVRSGKKPAAYELPPQPTEEQAPDLEGMD